MPDFLNALRMKSLFDPGQLGNDLPQQGGFGGNLGPTSIFQMPQQGSGMGDMFRPDGLPPTMPGPGGMDMSRNSMSSMPDEYDVNKRMSELYKPSNMAEQRMNTLLDAYPTAEKPSALRKIAAAVVGGWQGIDKGKAVLDAPFNKAVEDWKNKIGPTERAAQLENQGNANDRQMAYQTISQELRQQAQAAKEANDAEKLKVSQHRADVYDFKAKNPGMKLAFPKGGNIQAIDPQTGEAKDTGIPTGSMTELDKMNLTHDQRTDEIHTRGDETRETEGVKHTNRVGEIFARGDEARKTKSTPGGGTGGGSTKAELPTQTRIRQFNAARELWNSRPDLRPFIKLGRPGSNDFSVTPPSNGGFFSTAGPTAEQHKAINDAIYGKASIPINQPGRSNTADKNGQRMVKTQRNTKTGATREVESYDGGKTWQPVQSQ